VQDFISPLHKILQKSPDKMDTPTLNAILNLPDEFPPYPAEKPVWTDDYNGSFISRYETVEVSDNSRALKDLARTELNRRSTSQSQPQISTTRT
jgi:hypothetical protein